MNKNKIAIGLLTRYYPKTDEEKAYLKALIKTKVVEKCGEGAYKFTDKKIEEIRENASRIIYES